MNSDVNVVPQEKRYRFYVGKGIPDPWGSSKYIHHIYSYPIDSEKDSRFWRNKTQNCVRDYLFKCPDKSTANLRRYSFRDNHNKSQIFHKSHEKCNCEKLFRNYKSEKNLHRRSQYPKKGPGGDHSSVNCSSDTDGEHIGKCAGFCQYCEKHIVCNCNASEARFECEDPGCNEKCNNKKGKFFREEKVCFCPYLTSCFARKNLPDTGCQKLCFSKSKTPISKKIQTDSLIQCSKTVQTEKSKVKSQSKCTCFSKCYCNGLCTKRDCPQMNNFSNFCNCQKPAAFACPYSVLNHCHMQKPCKYQIKNLLKQPKKKEFNKKELEEKEAPRAEVEYFTLRNKIKEDGEEYEPMDSNNFKFDQSLFNIKNPSKTFDYLKDLSDYKLKGHLQQVEISPSILEQKLNTSSNFMDFNKRNPLLFNLRQKGDFKETSAYPDYRYGFPETPFSKNKINLTQSNLYAMGIGKFNKFSEATILPDKQIGNILNGEKGIQNMIRSTESDNSGLAKNPKPNNPMGKHKKLRIKKKKRKNSLLMSVSRDLFTARVNSTMMTINERFTYLQKKARPVQTSLLTIRAKNSAQQQASAKNRRLAMQMERRLSASAALKIKKKSIRQRLGVPNNSPAANVRDRLTLPARGKGIRRGRGGRAARGRTLRRSQSMQSLQGGNLRRSASMQSLNQEGMPRRSRSRSRSRARGRTPSRNRSNSINRQTQRSPSVGRQRRFSTGSFGTAAPNFGRGVRNATRGRNQRLRNKGTKFVKNQRGAGNSNRGGRGNFQRKGPGGRQQLRGGRRGRGRSGLVRGNAGGNQTKVILPSKEELDKQLEQYMANTKSHLDQEIDTYMKESGVNDL